MKSAILRSAQSYSYMLDGVGAEVAHNVRAKFLRGYRPMIMGRIYEGNCWTYYQNLYYDVWWSPLDNDLNSTPRDTAGLQRGDDMAYDFTQLVNGNIVFIGEKYVTSTDSGGIWTIVTDSTGRKKLWERQTKLPYKTEDGRNLMPLSVCATPDSGFTVVGKYTCRTENGDYNAFASHFVPKIPMAVPNIQSVPAKSAGIIASIKGAKLTVRFDSRVKNPQMEVYDARGSRIAVISGLKNRQMGNCLEWEFLNAVQGLYFYHVKAGGSLITGKVIKGLKLNAY